MGSEVDDKLKTIEDIILGEFDVEGTITKEGHRLIGKAKLQPDGSWLCLADVGGTFSRIEIRITWTEC